MEIDHTITGCDQSRRDQCLLQEELSEQNRALPETHIRDVRDMEELQKSHVVKVEERSKRKLTEDFEEVALFFLARMSRQSTSLATTTPSTLAQDRLDFAETTKHFVPEDERAS